ncbi:MAG: hypothetical protein O2875_05325 [Planctomycetota bacterium]|nr:hypothetical protein [Planctomycetota bacterium]
MLAIVLAVCLATQSGVENLTPQVLSLEEGARLRFSNMLMREAYVMVSPTDLSPSELEASIVLSRKATLLQPNNADLWRMTLALASLSGDMSPYASEITHEATARLVKLCPDDQVLRLRRILQDIDRRETAAERVKAFQKYLTPDAIKIIRTPVASRIAFDLALFESRIGDVDAFGNYLMQSLTLSAAFPAAAETAAGFINERIDDPVGECEMLVAAALSNPVETRSWSRLAALLLQEGAYGSAARVYKIAIQSLRLKSDVGPIQNILVCDYALSLWGADRPIDAIQVLSQFVHDLKLKQTNEIQSNNPGLMRAQCESVNLQLSTLLAMTDATIRAESNDSSLASSIATMIATATTQAESDDPEDQRGKHNAAAAANPEIALMIRERAESAAKELLDTATAAALIDADVSAVQGLLDLAERRFSFSDDTKIRFSAWKKLKSGDAAGALAIINQSVSTQPAALLIRAKILTATGDKKGAAKIYFDIARNGSGSLIGLFAASRLKAILGIGIPPSEVVGKLDGVTASIPSLMEKYISDLASPVLFQVVPEKVTVDPFDPIRYSLTLKNQSVIPLAITLAGPIKQHVLLQPRISSALNPAVDRLVPQVIPFDRAIELAPDESMSMNWDMAWTEVGLRINLDPLSGGIVDIRGASNFDASAGSFTVGVFGAQPSAQSIHVNGVRVTPEWLSSKIVSVASPKTDLDLVDLVLLAFAASKKTIDPEIGSAAWKAVAEGFAKLPPEGQAWVLLVGPRDTPEFEAVLDIARATTSVDVRCAYLLGYCFTQDDGQLAAALRTEDPLARLIVEVLASRFQRAAIRADEKMIGATLGAAAGTLEKIKEEQKIRQERLDK